MKHRALLTVILFVGASMAFADFAQTIQLAERLNDEEKHQEALQTLEAALETETLGRNKSEIYWRLARASMYLGDDAERSGTKGSQLLPFYEKGEKYGQMAIDADPANFNGYFWKSGNSGRWGQIKGVLNALAKAKDMQKLLTKAVELEPNDKGPFYVLGQLYNEVPGFPIGFGNIEHAVSLGRKGAYLMEQEVKDGKEETPDFDYYTELAKHLYARNWSAEKRAKVAADNKPKLAAAKDQLTRGFYYESTVTLASMSDREEARALVQKAIAGLESLSRRKLSEEDDLKEARGTLAGFK